MEKLNLAKLFDLPHDGTEPWIQIIWIYFPFFAWEALGMHSVVFLTVFSKI